MDIIWISSNMLPSLWTFVWFFVCLIFICNVFSCISKWIKAQGKQGRCPQCNAKATRNDIRILYCRNLKVSDTSEKDRALADLVIEKVARRKAEQDVSHYKAMHSLLEIELFQARDECQSLQSTSKHMVSHDVGTSKEKYFTGLTPQPSPMVDSSGHYKLIKSILISNLGNCRVISSCDYLNLLCVSQPSSNPIFRGYGIRKVNTMEQRLVKYVHLHQRPIRDLAFHPTAQDGILASASLDKTLRITSLLNDQIIQTYQCPLPVWSCCWADDSNRLFAGLSDGSVLLYDLRVTSGPLNTVFVPEINAPTLGLQYLSFQSNQTATGTLRAGLLVGQLTKVSFLSEQMPEPDVPMDSNNTSPNINNIEQHLDNDQVGVRSPELFETNVVQTSTNVSSFSSYQVHDLLLEGSLASLSAISNRGQFLASFRPSQRLPRVRHVFAELQHDNLGLQTTEFSRFTSHEIHNLWAGNRMKMLTRARLFISPRTGRSDLFAISGSEDVGGAIIWQCDDGSRFQTLQPPDVTSENPVIDVCPYSTTNTNSGFYLALLTERMLHLYVWHSANNM